MQERIFPFLRAAIAPSTRKKYEGHFSEWVVFLESAGYEGKRLDELPKQKQRLLVVDWIRHMRKDLLWGMSRINGCLAAVRHYFLSACWDIDIWSDPAVQSARKACALLIGKENIRRESLTQKYPLPMDVLLEARGSYMQNPRSIAAMTYAACCLAYHIVLRVSEFATGASISRHSITTGDVDFLFMDSEKPLPAFKVTLSTLSRSCSGVIIRVCTAKNDQLGRGHTHALYVTSESPEIERQVVKDLLNFAATSGAQQGDPFFRRYTNGRGYSLRPKDVSTLIKEMVSRVGADPRHFSAHSLRMGGYCQYRAKSSDKAGAAKTGRWAPGSTAPDIYEEALFVVGGAMSSDTFDGPLRLERGPLSRRDIPMLRRR